MFKEFFASVKEMNKNVRWFMLCVFINGIVSSAINVMLGIYYKEMGMAEGVIGGLMSIRTFGMSVGALFAIVLVQKMGTGRGLKASFSIMILSGLAFVNIQNLALMQAASLLFGMAQVVFTVVQAPFLKKNSDEKTVVGIFSVSFVLSNCAMFIGSFLFGILSDIFSSMGGRAFGSGLVLNVSFVTLGLAFFALMRIDFGNEQTIASQRTPIRDYFKILNRDTWLYMLKLALIGGGAGLIIPFFSVYIKYSLGASDSVVGIIMGFSQLGTVIGGLMVPKLARRFGRVNTVIVCQLLSLPFLLTISLAQGPVMMAISFFFRASFMNMANPVLQSMAMDLVAEKDRTIMSSIFSLSDNLFRAAGTSAGGFIMQAISYAAPYYVTVVMYIIATIVIYVVFGRNQKYKYLR